MGASLLTRVGLEELITETHEEYVEKAVLLAGDQDKITALRHNLRQRMRDSALGDAKRFARTLKHAFRDMGQRWIMETTGAEARVALRRILKSIF